MFPIPFWIWSNFFATYTSFAPSTLPLSGFLFSPDNDNEYLRSLPSFPCLDLTPFFYIHSFRPPHFFFGSLFLFFIFLSLFVRAPRDCLYVWKSWFKFSFGSGPFSTLVIHFLFSGSFPPFGPCNHFFFSETVCPHWRGLTVRVKPGFSFRVRVLACSSWLH